MKCPHCGAQIKEDVRFCTSCGGRTDGVTSAGGVKVTTRPDMPVAQHDVQSRFNHDKYLYSQPMLRVRDMYYVSDENGNELFYVHRLIFALKRHISIFTDRQRKEELMKIMQDTVFMILYKRFTLVDSSGQVLGRFRRNNLISILRRTWEMLSPDGKVLGQVIEDSWFKALFRRFGPLGEFFKTDFIFILGGREVGKFIRKWTIRDNYVLDLTGDPDKGVDRRMAVAMGVLLDTEEGR